MIAAFLEWLERQLIRLGEAAVARLLAWFTDLPPDVPWSEM